MRKCLCIFAKFWQQGGCCWADCRPSHSDCHFILGISYVWFVIASLIVKYTIPGMFLGTGFYNEYFWIVMMPSGVFSNYGFWLAPLPLLQMLYHRHKALTTGPTPRAGTCCHLLRSAWSLGPVYYTPVLLWIWRQAFPGWIAGDGSWRNSSDFSLSSFSPFWLCRWTFIQNLMIFLNGRELLLLELFQKHICVQHIKDWRDTQIWYFE